MSNTQPPDDDIIEDWLDTPLTEEKNEELGNIREEYEKGRQDAIEHKKNNEYWVFMVADYCATGEGRTILLMQTQALPKSFDYGPLRSAKYIPMNTQRERAIRAFKEIFGDWYSQGMVFITREEFFSKYSDYLPSKLIELNDKLCSIEFHTKLHFNFS